MAKKKQKRAAVSGEEQIKRTELKIRKLEAQKALISARAAYRAIK